MNRRRLDAESVRDAILQAAGRLDPTMGGPSVQQFALSPGVHVTPVVDYTQYRLGQPGLGPAERLPLPLPHPPRPVHGHARRGRRLAADRRRGASRSRRSQALALLNNPFVLRHERAPGRDGWKAMRRDLRRSGPRRPFLLAFGRTADAGGARLSSAATPGGTAWRTSCRLLFNSNEFLFVN